MTLVMCIVAHRKCLYWPTSMYAGVPDDASIVHVEPVSSQAILVVLHHEIQLYFRNIEAVNVKNHALGYDFTKRVYAWRRRPFALHGVNFPCPGRLLTVKFHTAAQLLAVLSEDGDGNATCTVYSIHDDATIQPQDVFPGGSAEIDTHFAHISPALVTRVLDTISAPSLCSGTTSPSARAFWHTIARPQWNFLYLVVYSNTQCSTILIPGDIKTVRCHVTFVYAHTLCFVVPMKCGAVCVLTCPGDWK